MPIVADRRPFRMAGGRLHQTIEIQRDASESLRFEPFQDGLADAVFTQFVQLALVESGQVTGHRGYVRESSQSKDTRKQWVFPAIIEVAQPTEAEQEQEQDDHQARC